MSSGLCCDKCFALIAKRNTSAAKLWLDLCEIQLTLNVFGLLLPEIPGLRLLEVLDFIATTETRDLVIVKVYGKKNMGGKIFFCGGYCG